MDWIARRQGWGEGSPEARSQAASPSHLRTNPPVKVQTDHTAPGAEGGAPRRGEGDPRTPPPLAVRNRAAHERRKAPRPGGARGQGTGKRKEGEGVGCHGAAVRVRIAVKFRGWPISSLAKMCFPPTGNQEGARKLIITKKSNTILLQRQRPRTRGPLALAAGRLALTKCIPTLCIPPRRDLSYNYTEHH